VPGVYDLCDREEAIDAGLDGGNLRRERLNLGIDCGERGVERYAYVSDDGDFVRRSTIAAAERAGREQGERPPPPSIEFGYYSDGWLPREEPAGRAIVRVVAGSVGADGSTLRGLVRNESTTEWARDVVVSIGSASWRSAFTLQPGESVPFEIATTSTALPPDESELSAVASFSATPDAGRALELSGMPGYLPDGRTFETGVSLGLPDSDPEVAEDIRGGVVVRDVVVLAAFFDDKGAVIGVEELTIMLVDGDESGEVVLTELDRPMRVGDIGSASAILVDYPNAPGIAVWAGGVSS